jgi:hypothetical protein
MLAKIAILVDYYNCKEAVEPFTEMWITDLKKVALPVTYCRDLILWVWAAWTFDMKEQLKQATAVAIRESTELMRTIVLPIPERVSSTCSVTHSDTRALTCNTGEIDLQRYHAIESIVGSLQARLERYHSPSYVCPANNAVSFQCGCFLLGALTKGTSSLTLLT